MKFLNDFPITLSLALMLTILSGPFTNFYTTNILEYIFLALTFTLSILLSEFLLNRKYDDTVEKAKKLYLYIMPINLVIFTIAGYFLLL